MGKLKVEEWTNRVICGDTLETLKQMPSEIISCCMFSPPYWSLRDYKVKGQIGLEKDFNEYLAKMWLIFDELWRVLRKDGTMWVNMGDGYHNATKWTYKDGAQTISKGNPRDLLTGRKQSQGLAEKCLLMLPERLMLGLLERGWILRNKCIWQKPNPMPCSAKDRFTTTWEYLYFLTKSKKYWFDLDAVRRPHLWADRDKRAMNGLKHLSNGKSRDNQYAIDGVSYHPAGKNPGDVITTKIQQEDAEKMGSPRARQWRSKREKELIEFFEKKGSGGNPDAPFDGHPAGANPGDFMVIPTQPSSLPHYASYPEKLCEIPLKAGCPRWICRKCGKARVRVTKAQQPPEELYTKNTRPNDGLIRAGQRRNGKLRGSGQKVWDWMKSNPPTTLGWSYCPCLCPACGEADCKCGEKWRPGIVLDPFVGIGTTCIVAKKLGFDYIGIDIKKEYCDMAEKRLKDVKYQEVLNF